MDLKFLILNYQPFLLFFNVDLWYANEHSFLWCASWLQWVDHPRGLTILIFSTTLRTFIFGTLLSHLSSCLHLRLLLFLMAVEGVFGCRSSINFWNDLWARNYSLRSSFSNIYTLFIIKISPINFFHYLFMHGWKWFTPF